LAKRASARNIRAALSESGRKTRVSLRSPGLRLLTEFDEFEVSRFLVAEVSRFPVALVNFDLALVRKACTRP
jgi:hypothetical protein